MFILITRTLFLVPRAFPLEIGRGEKNPGDEVAKDRTVVVLLMRPRRSELFKKNCMIYLNCWLENLLLFMRVLSLRDRRVALGEC